MSVAHALSYTLATRTDVGRARALNQDSVGCALLPGPSADRGSLGQGALLLSVFDGMGGGQGGEVASQLATEAVLGGLALMTPGADAESSLDEALQGAHRAIRAAARERGLRDMGTTATVAVLQGRRALIGQVGDSRAYLLRGGALRQLTRDQSLAQQLVDQGVLRPDEARTFEHGNIILQALGTSPAVQPVFSSSDLLPGDTLLLCSDGLWGELPDDLLARTLASAPDPDEACRRLVDAANEAGGSDNISCVVCRIEGPPAGDNLNLSFQPDGGPAPPPPAEQALPGPPAPPDDPLPPLPLRPGPLPALLLALALLALGLASWR